MLVAPDIERNAVVIDGILHQPVPARVAVTQIRLAHELAVGDIDESIGDGDADLHRLDLVVPLIFVGPPNAGADALAGGVDPRAAGRVLLESDGAEAASFDGIAGIVEIDGVCPAGTKGLGEIDEDR